jgi:hypothetical protein
MRLLALSPSSRAGGAKARGDAAQLTAQTALNTRLTGLAGDVSDRETAKMGSGDGAYVEDHSRADYASDAEIAALNSMVNDFGGEGVDSDNLNDLTIKSGKSNETQAEKAARLYQEQNPVQPAATVGDIRDEKTGLEKMQYDAGKAITNGGKKMLKSFGYRK